ncbi:MAG: hypothetical protein ACI8RD_002838 [Bacillariaceae sp.]
MFIKAQNNLPPGKKRISFKKDVLEQLKVMFGQYEQRPDYTIEKMIGINGNATRKQYAALQKDKISDITD